mgnify:CR=1 FL=1
MNNVSSSNSQKALVPELRFPEFREEWKKEKLSNFVVRVTRKNKDNQSNLPLTISSKDGLVDQVTYFNKKVSSKDMSGYYLLKNGEFAYNKSYSVGYDFGSIKRLDMYDEGALSTLYICFALKKHNSDFIKTYFNSLKWYKEIYMIAAEGARNHGLLNVPTEDFFDTVHTLPKSIEEQTKIADFLTLLEQRILKQEKLVNALKLYKRGLIFSLFKENNVFNLPVERLPLSTLLTEYKNKNSVGLRVCSVAVNKGVVDQVEHLGRSFSANDTSKYNQVKQGDIIYTKSPTGDFPFGIVKQNKLNEVVAVSPLYGVYTPKNYEVGNLLHHYFEQHQNANNYIKPLAQKGAKNTINITNQNFLAGNVLFPKNSNDIVKMSQAFETIQKQIECNELLHNQLILTKSYFLQKMFI